MREQAHMVPPNISFGDDCVVLSRAGQSRKIVSRILGSEVDPETGLKTVWLDRQIHRRGENDATNGSQQWKMDGAVSTVLREAGTAVAR